jgi:glutaredoxin
MYKKFLYILGVLFTLFIFAPSVLAAQKVDVYFYRADGCPHCAAEEVFLDNLLKSDKYKTSVDVHEYEVLHSSKNLDLMKEALAKFDQQVSGVPVTIIGDQVITGFGSEATSGKEIQAAIDDLLAPSQASNDNNGLIMLPIVGALDPAQVSLPIITTVIGLLDGFNPCAMWTLIFLISMLLNMKNRKRMWILGTAFIVASSGMYFVFMAAWLNFILFIGFVTWIRLLIGAFALGGGGWNLKKYFVRKNDSGCEVTDADQKRKLVVRIKEVVHKQNFWLALVGIVVLAASVNLVELICSAGLPAVYTQILALNNLSTWQYYGYLLLYIFFYMLDDLVIFIIAMITLRTTAISTRYSKWSSLIGGILMLIIGLLLIFKPGWLMFG